MKSFAIFSAIALCAVAQNATAPVAATPVDPFASITTQNAYEKCASGPAYMSCDSKLGAREPCTYTESAASASCSCAYASSRMACNAICTDNQIDLAIGCPKPTSWSYYPGWSSSSMPASSSATTTMSSKKSSSTSSSTSSKKSTESMSSKKSSSEVPCTWTTSTTSYTTVCSSYVSKESGKPGSWTSYTSTVVSTSSWSYPVTYATATPGMTTTYGSTMKPSTTTSKPSVEMVSKAGAAPLQTGLGAAAAMAFAGLLL